MYKRALTVLLTAHLLFLAGFLCLGQMEEIQRNLQIKVPVAADSESRMIGIASRTSSGQRVVDCNELQRNSRYHLDMVELEVLLKIVPVEIPEGTPAKRKLLLKAARGHLEGTAKILNYLIDIGLLT